MVSTQRKQEYCKKSRTVVGSSVLQTKQVYQQTFLTNIYILHTRLTDIVQGLSCRLPYLSADGEGEGERRKSGMDISILIPELLRLLLSGLCSRGLRRLKCRSTHLSMVSTESVLGKRRSAAVRTIWDDVTRKVAAIPFRACEKRQSL